MKTRYDYNVRSWIKKISGTLFNQTLYYNENRTSSTNIPSYSGNISAMDWSVSGDKVRGYDFAYDDLSRLTAAHYLENGIRNSDYNTSYTYDKHGNMRTLNRRGNTGATSFGEIDNLTLHYQGNQLLRVDETAAAPNLSTSISMDFRKGANQVSEYSYDQNGNMTMDLNKGISDIRYNSLNLPDKLVISDAMGTTTNTYLYSADGRKLNVTSRWGTASSKNTDYVGNMIYENGSLKRILVSGGYIEGGLYYFYLTDHLGNNRVVAKADGTVVQSNHYYPFGMSFSDGVSISSQPYKFGNKELDTDRGLNWYDFSARYKTVGLPPFTTMDPLAEKYYSWSPYAYCANNPMNRIDPDGRDWRITTRYNEESRKIEYNMTVNAVLYNNSKDSSVDMEQLSTAIQQQINEVYNILGDSFVAKMDFNLRIVSSVDEIGERDHVIQIVDQADLGKSFEGTIVAKASTPGLNIKLGSVAVRELLDGTDKRTVAHELGHTGGLLHLKEKESVNNLMMQAVKISQLGGNYSNSTQLNHTQVRSIRDNYINNKLNYSTPLRSDWFRKYIVK